MIFKFLIPVLNRIPTLKDLPALYGLAKFYLRKKGWLVSYHSKESLDQNLEMVPWLTYSFVRFLEEKDLSKLSLIEYGAGSSTRWFADRFANVNSIENNADWYSKIKDTLSKLSNVTIHLIQDMEVYPKAIEHLKLQSPDILLVDGRKRVECIKNAVPFLNEQSVILLDNSERTKYEEAFTFLSAQGFKNISFYGLSPGCPWEAGTTVFYRSKNCLHI